MSTYLIGFAVLFAGALSVSAESAPDWAVPRSYLWQHPFDRDDYQTLLDSLPEEQRKALAAIRGPNREMVPLNLAIGRAAPRVTYLLCSGGEATEAYVDFPKVRFLDLYYATIGKGAPASQIARARVTSLSLPAKGMSSREVAQLLTGAGALPRLAHVELPCDGNAVAPEVLQEILKARPELESIGLSGPDASDKLVDVVAQSAKLRGVRFCDNSMGDAELRLLSRSPSLSHVSLDWCSGVTPKGLLALSELRTLKELQLVVRPQRDQRGLTNMDVALEVVSRHPSIERLVVQCDSLTPRGIRALARMKTLRTLVLRFERHKETLDAARHWRDDDVNHRRLILEPDEYLGGWVGELCGEWVIQRGYVPVLMP